MTRRTSRARTSTGQPETGAPSTRAASAPQAGVYGPAAHNAWTLSGDTVSLVRQPKRPRPLTLAAQPQAVRLDLARSALVIVDMQNDFCHPKGWFGQKGIDVRPMRRPIPVIAGLLPAWRAAGGAVVWLHWGVRPDRLNLSPTIQFKGRHPRDGGADLAGYAEASPDDRGLSVVPGHWGAQAIDELPPAPGDITVFKHRLSGFWDNELDSVLRGQGLQTLLFAGVNTDRCVFSTLQDAGFLGYDCLLLEDACGTPSPAYVSRAIPFIVRQLHGFTATAADLLAALPTPRGSARPDGAARAASASRPKRSST
ncbi:MAG: cysteine hydrolase [Betaproteobacteria bacterium]|nr:cysteine hydrolase [Betaproteobacteria bacterium]